MMYKSSSGSLAIPPSLLIIDTINLSRNFFFVTKLPEREFRKKKSQAVDFFMLTFKFKTPPRAVVLLIGRDCVS